MNYPIFIVIEQRMYDAHSRGAFSLPEKPYKVKNPTHIHSRMRMGFTYRS